MPGAGWHPRSRVQDALKNAHTSIQVQPKQPGIPCELCKPPPASRKPRAPGPHGFAVRSFLRHQLRPAKCMPAEAMTKAFKRRSSARDVRSRKPALQTPFAPDAAASTATRPNVRDDGQRPSSRDGMAGVVGVIWVSREAEYFFGRDWTGQISLTLLQKIADWRSSEVPTSRETSTKSRTSVRSSGYDLPEPRRAALCRLPDKQSKAISQHLSRFYCSIGQ
jgi:hypothetical protein